MFTLGLVAAGLSVAAPAQAAQLPMTPATCNVLHREVKQGKTSFSNMDRILYGSKQTVYNNTMELYSQSAYNDAIKKGAQMWEQATGGKLKFKMVSAPTPRSVTIVDEHWREGSALGYGGAGQQADPPDDRPYSCCKPADGRGPRNWACHRP